MDVKCCGKFYNGDAVEDLSRNQIRAVSEYSACEACLDQVDPNLKDFISLWEDEYGELDAL